MTWLDAVERHIYCENVKNITVSLNDELYHAARIVAAQRKTNLTALVRRYLQAVAKGEAPELSDSDSGAAERAQREELAGLFADAHLVLGYQPNRDTSYER